MIETDRVYERKLQKKHDSYIITVPKEMVRQLNVKPGQNIEFHPYKDALILKKSGHDLTKKDKAEADKVLVDKAEFNKYDRALQKALEMDHEEQQKSEKQPEMSRLERLRLK